MNIKIKLFSHLRYRLRTEILVIEVTDQITIREMKLKIYKLGGSNIRNIPFRVAVNGNFVNDDYLIEGSDEIALIPPVQGG